MTTHLPGREAAKVLARRRGGGADALPDRARADRAQRRPRLARARRHPHRGVPIANRLRALVAERRACTSTFGAVDITFHRDDVLVRGGGPPLHPQPVVRGTELTSRSRGRRSCSSTTCSSPAARSARRSTRCSSTGGPHGCSSPSSSTGGTASFRSGRTTSARTSPPRSPSASAWSSTRRTTATASCCWGGQR